MWGEVLVVQRRAVPGRGGGVFGQQPGDRVGAQWSASTSREHRIGWAAVVFMQPGGECGYGVGGKRGRAVFASLAVLCRALVYAEQRFGEIEMPCQVRESGLGDVGQLGIILVADRGFLHAGPWVSGEGGDDDESVRGRGEWLASAVQARF